MDGEGREGADRDAWREAGRAGGGREGRPGGSAAITHCSSIRMRDLSSRVCRFGSSVFSTKSWITPRLRVLTQLGGLP